MNKTYFHNLKPMDQFSFDNNCNYDFIYERFENNFHELFDLQKKIFVKIPLFYIEGAEIYKIANCVVIIKSSNFLKNESLF